ncbi:hypothetical protein [Sinorhizobium arboris]|uniref:hypothetical protein n=1 Tax=Sinorhizobium arboris TaxID=76745 RepID=UPI000420BA53|nr:hypothetical protein [Sinorhizobium arboris]
MLAVAAKLPGTAHLRLPTAPAQQIAEQLEFIAKSALLQRFGIIEDEKRKFIGASAMIGGPIAVA